MIKTSRCIEILQYEVECIKRQDTEKCDRNCAKCDLVQDTEEILSVYQQVIALLRNKDYEKEN